MTDLVRYEPAAPRVWIELLAPAAQLAEAVAKTEFVPAGLRGNVAAITAAILYGDEVGLSPMQSLAKVHVIDGRPALSAEAQRSLVLAAGHEMWIVDASNTKVTWAGRRTGSTNTVSVTWTLDDAKKAGLDGRQNWRKYPRAMLSARSSAELARALFADAIGGLMAVEELEEGGPPDDLGPDETAAAAGPGVRKARRPRKTAPAEVESAAPVPVTPSVLPALPGATSSGPVVSPAADQHGDGDPADAHAERVSAGSLPEPDEEGKARAQRVAMMCAEFGHKSDDARHTFLHAFTEGRTSSSYGIEADEMAAMRAALVRLKRGETVIVDGVIVLAKSGLVDVSDQ